MNVILILLFDFEKKQQHLFMKRKGAGLGSRVREILNYLYLSSSRGQQL